MAFTGIYCDLMRFNRIWGKPLHLNGYVSWDIMENCGGDGPDGTRPEWKGTGKGAHLDQTPEIMN
jgi:hypothetical protein